MDANGLGMGFLVVGAGFLGSGRAAAAMAARGCRLVAVCDSNERVARSVASRHGVRVATEFAEALAWEAVEAVIVATPHADHAGQVRMALEAGKHVLCEKPMTIGPEQARALATLADDRRLRLATGFNHRFYPPVRDALSLVAVGAIGRVEAVRAGIGHRASPEFLSSWHTDPSRSGGGTLMDNGPHACDLIRRLLGEVVAAEGSVRNIVRPGCEADAQATFRGQDGGIGALRCTWTDPSGYLTIEIIGDEGRLRVETAPWGLSGFLASGRRLRNRYIADRFAERRFRGLFGCERSLVRELEAFVAPIANQPRAEGTGWDGCRVTEMIDAVYRSDRTGAEVALEPAGAVTPSIARRRAAYRGQWA